MLLKNSNLSLICSMPEILKDNVDRPTAWHTCNKEVIPSYLKVVVAKYERHHILDGHAMKKFRPNTHVHQIQSIFKGAEETAMDPITFPISL